MYSVDELCKYTADGVLVQCRVKYLSNGLSLNAQWRRATLWLPIAFRYFDISSKFSQNKEILLAAEIHRFSSPIWYVIGTL